MIAAKDQIGRELILKQNPSRIISLVPSITELLFHLGLEDAVVGITKFCVHPAQWFTSKTRIGGTKTLNIKKIKSLQPDLIIANKEENVKEQVELLAHDFPVYISDVYDLNSALEMIVGIGLLTDRSSKALELVEQIKTVFSSIPLPVRLARVCYLIWQKPYMTVGGDTFIHHMLAQAGFQNIYSDQTRYPTLDLCQLPRLNCEHIFLSSEPFPFSKKHASQIKKALAHCVSASPVLTLPKIHLVDGEMFSWYGSRLLLASVYLRNLQASVFLW